MTEVWAEIRRLHKSEQMSIKAIVRRTGLERNTIRAALVADEPPKYQRDPAGSADDGFEPAIRALLAEFPPDAGHGDRRANRVGAVLVGAAGQGREVAAVVCPD